MPLEGHAQRLATPLQRSDRRFIALLGVAGVLAAGAAAGVYASNDRPAHAARCVDVTVASTVGGAALHVCGAAATTFCRTEGPKDERNAAACRREGFPVGPG